MNMDSTDYDNGLIDKAKMNLWIKLYIEHEYSHKESRDNAIKTAFIEFDEAFPKACPEDLGPG